VNAGPTFMRREIGEIAQAAANLLERSGTELRDAGRRLRDRDPLVIVTVARGSSDHAAAYLKYVIELKSGIPVASLGPSIASIYGATLKLPKAACLAISQSGKSPDIVRMTETAGFGGALTFALTNTPGSPLAAACDHVIDIAAGEERSVAATKTFVNSAVAGLALVAHWTEDDVLLTALDALPAQLQAATECDWSPLAEALQGQESLFILGRGPSFAIAQEAALKFKETCAFHAEAYSGAEVMHGPVSIVGKDFPVLALTARDAAERSSAETADLLSGKGAAVFSTSPLVRSARKLPVAPAVHPLLDPLALVVSFYAFIEEFARRRGMDPDRPVNLKKVTETE
jgi:glutamine---fructose-6-phosphate transaminase (isomerizing)